MSIYRTTTKIDRRRRPAPRWEPPPSAEESRKVAESLRLLQTLKSIQPKEPSHA